MMVWIALILGFIWGAIWAAVLQWMPLGQFLARKRTWLTVVIGVGMDLLIMRLVVCWEVWLEIAGIVAASSVAIIGRSLWNELQETNEVLDVLGNGHENAAGK
jgi:hypothetical protein